MMDSSGGDFHTQKGYQMQTEVSQKDTPSKVTEEMRKDQEEESVCINQYSFDVRA